MHSARQLIRLLSTALMASGLVALGAVSAPAHAAAGYCFSYTEPSGTDVLVTAGSGCSGALTIPAQIVDGATTYDVIGIDSAAFQNSGLTSVVIPDSVLTTGNRTFSGSTALTSVTFAGTSTITILGDQAFKNTGLTSFQVPASVTIIGYESLAGNNALTSVTFAPGSVLTTLVDGALRNNPLLTSITLPTSTTSIGAAAFFSADSLASINLSSLTRLTTIGATAFQYTALTSVTIPASVTDLGAAAFYGAGNLRTVLVASGSGLGAIQPFTFLDCPISNLRLPSSVTAIGEGAFYNTNLPGVALPANLTSIGTSAFASNERLAFVDFPDGLTTIGALSFQGTALASVVIPSSVTGIGFGAFYELPTLTDLILPDTGSLVIGGSAFTRSSVQGSLTFSPAVTQIGDSAFEGTQLTDVTFPAEMTAIGPNAFAEIPTLTSVTFPETGTLTIGGYAFYNDQGLTALDIPASVTSIGDGAFFVADNLATVTVAPAGLTSIGADAFYKTAITSFTIPSTVTTIGDGAFEWCRQLTAFTLAGDNGSFSVDGEGVLFNKAGTELVAYPAGRPGSYAIPAVSSIRARAFYGASGLTSVTVNPDATLASIPSYAFADTGITAFHMPATVTSLGRRAFRGAQLATLTFDGVSQLADIGQAAFERTRLTAVRLPASVTSIGDDAFDSSEDLSSMTFDGAAPAFGDAAFYGTAMGTVYYNPATSGWPAAFDGPLSGFNRVRMAAPAFTAESRPRVTGVARKGRVLLAATGSWSSDVAVVYSYAWFSCKRKSTAVRTSLPASLSCKAISGKRSSRLVLGSKQRGRYVTVRITATNTYGSTSVYAPTKGRIR